MLAFTLADEDSAARFLTGAELVTEATSFGAVQTTAERRARWGSDAVAEGFIRFSAGIEDTEDLVADVRAALDAL
jgi:cystathionine gamma-lyase